MPSMPGIFRSVSTTSGANSSSLPSALKPSAAVSTVIALVAQQLGERRARVDLVVDDEDPSAWPSWLPVSFRLAPGSSTGSPTPSTYPSARGPAPPAARRSGGASSVRAASRAGVSAATVDDATAHRVGDEDHALPAEASAKSQSRPAASKSRSDNRPTIDSSRSTGTCRMRAERIFAHTACKVSVGSVTTSGRAVMSSDGRRDAS